MGGKLDWRVLKKQIVPADQSLADAFETDVGREFKEIYLLRYLAQEPEVPVAYLQVWVDPIFESISDVLETEGLQFQTIVELMRIHFDRKINSSQYLCVSSQLPTKKASFP